MKQKLSRRRRSRVTVSITMPPEIKERAVALARERYQTLSGFVGMLLERELNDNPACGGT